MFKKKEMLALGVSAILLILFIPPSIIIHEGGHLMTCKYLGFEPSDVSLIDFDLKEFKLIGMVTCPGIEYEQDLFILWVSGGLLSSAVFASLLIIPYVRHNAWILTPIIAIICKELSTAYIETYFHYWYIMNNNDATRLTMVILGIGFIITWLCLNEKQNKHDNKYN